MKAKLIWSLLAAAFVVLIGYRIVVASQARGAVVDVAIEAPLVRTTKVSRADVSETVQLTGNVQADSEVAVFAKQQGTVDNVSVKVGDAVRAGQVLATVEHKEIAWQAKQAQAGVEAAKAGHLMAIAGRDGAQMELGRTRQLAEGGAAPAAALEGAELKLQAAEAQVAAAAAQVSQASAVSGLMQQQVANARITTPIDGVVTAKNLEVGAMASQQVPAFVVQDARTLKLKTSVDLATFARIQKGQKVAITAEDLPGETFDGHVALMSPTLDAQTRRAAIEIAIDNGNGRLLPHAFAKASVTLGELSQALVVPRDAVLQTSTGALVYRIRDGVAEALTPRTGPRTDALITVLDSLNEGDVVALGGLGQLSNGARVRVAVAAAASNEAPTASIETR